MLWRYLNSVLRDSFNEKELRVLAKTFNVMRRVAKF